MLDFKIAFDCAAYERLLYSDCEDGHELREWLANAVLPLIAADGAYLLWEENNASTAPEEQEPLEYEAALTCPNGDGPELRRWVLEEILPALHHQGVYATGAHQPLENPDEEAARQDALVASVLQAKFHRYTLPNMPYPVGFTFGHQA